MTFNLDTFGSPALAALLAVWAALLFGGFIFGRRSPDGSRRMPAWTRLGSSLALVLAAGGWLSLATPYENAASVYAFAVLVGMSLGFLGDLFMAKLIIRSEKAALGGMAAFGLGHIAYIGGFLQFGDAIGANQYRAAAWLVWLVVGLVGWYLAVYRGQGGHGVMHFAALPYALLLSSTAGVATGLALDESRFIPLALGCALFLLSDLLIAARMFAGVHFRLIDDVIWLTYGPAQMLIVYSVGVALKA
jgi:hypothetical protein